MAIKRKTTSSHYLLGKSFEEYAVLLHYQRQKRKKTSTNKQKKKYSDKTFTNLAFLCDILSSKVWPSRVDFWVMKTFSSQSVHLILFLAKYKYTICSFTVHVSFSRTQVSGFSAILSTSSLHISSRVPLHQIADSTPGNGVE